MARTKISKIATDLNIALPTVVDFLRKQNIEVEDSPNARVDDSVVDLLVEHFKSDKDLKTRSEKFSSERQQPKKIKQEQGAKTEVEQPSTQTFKIVGKIELDKDGNPIAKTKEQPKAETTPAKPVETKKQEEKVQPKQEIKAEVTDKKIEKEPVKEPAQVKQELKPVEKTEPQKKAPVAEPEPVAKPQSWWAGQTRSGP